MKPTLFTILGVFKKKKKLHWRLPFRKIAYFITDFAHCSNSDTLEEIAVSLLSAVNDEVRHALLDGALRAVKDLRHAPREPLGEILKKTVCYELRQWADQNHGPVH